ncbi:MAG: metallophosphoesterase [Chloroflexota bacterium]|nr:MAG: metallophosphoesterase [Chloroflexota bacterium]
MSFFSRKSKSKPTRLYFATDVHGSERTYRKFLNAGKFYEVDVLVMGGDITGKLLVPIIDEGNGNYRATLQGEVERLTTQDELEKLEDRLRTLGFYFKTMKEDEFKHLQENPTAVDELFHEQAKNRLSDWIDLAESRLKGTGIRCFVTGGNDDDPEVLEVMKRENTEAFIACEGEAVMVDSSHSMISVGFSTYTPWDTPREVSDEELGDMIEEMIAKVQEPGKSIFNFHDPPNDSTLDTCPKLDWDTDPPTPIVEAGQIVMHGAGSKSVRKAIETYQPLLGLHGHIHESQSVAKIGKTTCINPGSEYGEGVLRGCIVIMNEGNIEGYQMTRG